MLGALSLLFYTVNLEENYLMLIEILFDIYFYHMQLNPLEKLLFICYQIKLPRNHWRYCFLSLLPQYCSVYFIPFVTTNDSLSIWTHHKTKTVHEQDWQLKIILIRSPTWVCNSIGERSRVPEYLTLSRKSSHTQRYE